MRLLAAALAVAAVGCTTPPPPPPCGIVPDGAIDEAAWREGQVIGLRGGAELRLVQGPAHVCIAALPGETPRFIDLFLTDATGATHNLHASMQVGERTLPGARWTDERPPTAWGQTTGWRANAAPRRSGVAADAPIGEQLAPFDGYEFVLARARFPRPWRIRVELREFARPSRTVAWPAESRRADKRTWALLP